jgi:hypothetical protein
MRFWLSCLFGVSVLGGLPMHAQQPIGRTSAQEVKVSGAMDVHAGEMLLGNGSAVTAGEQAVNITLTRGGELRLCPTTTVHLSRDSSLDKQDSTALMMALDRGALEANYAAGTYSDVLMTPDFRILVSGPGTANLSVRVSAKGDTCVDNHGANAPYVTVSSLFDGGVYRVQPDQRVLFERGSLRDVVDSEKEICGCPAAAVSLASAGTTGNTPAAPGASVGGPSSTPADTTFPLAVSEGLAAPPTPPQTTPETAPGEVHVAVTVPLTYNGATGKAGDPAELAAVGAAAAENPPAPAPAAGAPAAKPVESATAVSPGSQPKPKSGGVFHRIGRFFSHIFGN